MTRHEPFDLEVGEGVVRGTLRGPDDEGPAPCVLICCDLPGSVDDSIDVIDDVSAALLAEGLACARYAPREDDAEAADRASTAVDDAAGVLRWLQLREDIEPTRVGLLGYGLGAVVAATLAGRTDQIARLCLLAPTTTGDAIARLEKTTQGKTNGRPPLLDGDAVPAAFVTSLANLAPTTAVAVHDRATLILQGAADRVIPPAAAQPYIDAIEEAGHRCEHEMIALADHAFSESAARALCLARIRRFFGALKATGSP